MADELHDTLSRIVGELHDLVERRVQAAIAEALARVREESTGQVPARPKGPQPVRAGAQPRLIGGSTVMEAPSEGYAPTGKKKTAKVPTSGPRVRRSSEDLQAIGEQVLDALRAQPGMTSEQIQAATGLSKGDIQRPIELLKEAKRLRTKGERRGMQYFAR